MGLTVRVNQNILELIYHINKIVRCFLGALNESMYKKCKAMWDVFLELEWKYVQKNVKQCEMFSWSLYMKVCTRKCKAMWDVFLELKWKCVQEM
jgi:hypothetical protein